MPRSTPGGPSLASCGCTERMLHAVDGETLLRPLKAERSDHGRVRSRVSAGAGRGRGRGRGRGGGGLL